MFVFGVVDGGVFGVVGGGEADFVEDEEAFEDFPHEGLDEGSGRGEEVFGGSLAEQFETVDGHDVSELFEDEVVLVLVGGVCLERDHHFEEYVHQTDNLQVVPVPGFFFCLDNHLQLIKALLGQF